MQLESPRDLVGRQARAMPAGDVVVGFGGRRHRLDQRPDGVEGNAAEARFCLDAMLQRDQLILSTNGKRRQISEKSRPDSYKNALTAQLGDIERYRSWQLRPRKRRGQHAPGSEGRASPPDDLHRN